MILIVAFTCLHVLFYLKLAYGWRSIKSTQSRDAKDTFSILIPTRNEEQNIEKVIRKLENQNYPKELFEVIIINDFSEDGTVEIVNSLKETLEIDIRLLNLNNESEQGKKHALTAGVRVAKYEKILTTDADCWFDSDWIDSYNDAFSESINMVAGPVAIQGKGLFATLQQIEFAGLMGFGAVTISQENPSMCSGANLGFKKTAFTDVGGYSNNLFTPSGDDEFLLFNIMNRFPNTTSFLKSKRAVVSTLAHKGLRSFVNQRTRWTSKWKYNKNWKVRISAILFFLDYLIYYLAIAGALIGFFDILPILFIALARLVANLIFIFPINKFLNGASSFLPLFILQLIYPAHVLFMGMNSIFGSYTWKGRKYQ